MQKEYTVTIQYTHREWERLAEVLRDVLDRNDLPSGDLSHFGLSGEQRTLITELISI